MSMSFEKYSKEMNTIRLRNDLFTYMTGDNKPKTLTQAFAYIEQIKKLAAKWDEFVDSDSVIKHAHRSLFKMLSQFEELTGKEELESEQYNMVSDIIVGCADALDYEDFIYYLVAMFEQKNLKGLVTCVAEHAISGDISWYSVCLKRDESIKGIFSEKAIKGAPEDAWTEDVLPRSKPTKE